MKKRLMTVFLPYARFLPAQAVRKMQIPKYKPKVQRQLKKPKSPLRVRRPLSLLSNRPLKAMRSSIRPSKSTFWAEVRRQA